MLDCSSRLPLPPYRQSKSRPEARANSNVSRRTDEPRQGQIYNAFSNRSHVYTKRPRPSRKAFKAPWIRSAERGSGRGYFSLRRTSHQCSEISTSQSLQRFCIDSQRQAPSEFEYTRSAPVQGYGHHDRRMRTREQFVAWTLTLKLLWLLCHRTQEPQDNNSTRQDQGAFLTI